MTHAHRIVAYSQLHPLARAIVLQSALTNPLLTDDGRPVMLPLEVPVARPRPTTLAHSVRRRRSPRGLGAHGDRAHAGTAASARRSDVFVRRVGSILRGSPRADHAGDARAEVMSGEFCSVTPNRVLKPHVRRVLLAHAFPVATYVWGVFRSRASKKPFAMSRDIRHLQYLASNRRKTR